MEKIKLSLHYGQKRILDNNTHKFLINCAGVRYGKTTLGARWKFMRVCANPNSKESLVIAPDAKLLRAKCLTEYVNLLQQVGLREGKNMDYEVNHSFPFVRHNHHPSKHVVYFLSAEAPEKIRGYTASDAWADEVSICDETVHKHLVQRVSCPNATKMPQLLYTTTPEGDEGWFAERFNREDVVSVKGQPFRMSEDVFILEGSMYDNPSLTDEYLSTIEAEFSWDQPYFETYVLGKFTSLARDRFYFSFVDREHVGNYPFEPSVKQLYLCWDENVDLMSWTVIQNINGEYRVCAENGSKGRNIADACAQFEEQFSPERFRDHRIVVLGDGSLHRRSTHSYATGYEIIEHILKPKYPRLTVEALHGEPFIEERSRCTNKLFATGKLKIHEECRAVIKSLKKTKKGKRGGIEKPTGDEHTHAMESVDMALLALNPPTIDIRGGLNF